MLSPKLLIDVSIDTFAAKTAIGGVNPPPSLIALLLSVPWLPRQAQAVI
jgi:hypothetical protein